MSRIFYIILIAFVFFKINSCAEIDMSSETGNSYFKEQIWSQPYDILIGTALVSSDNLFAFEQTSTEQVVNLTPKKNNIFLVKQNSFGEREWIMDLGISDVESGISMTFDSSDNVYITGYERNIFKGNKNSVDFTVFLFKYNSFGSKEWTKKLGKSEVEYGARLIVDSSDNIYVTGFSSEFESDNKLRNRDTLLAKFDTSGNREWIKKLRSTVVDFEWDLTYDSHGNIYVTGFSENSFIHNNWEEDILLMKFNKDGIKF